MTELQPCDPCEATALFLHSRQGPWWHSRRVSARAQKGATRRIRVFLFSHRISHFLFPAAAKGTAFPLTRPPLIPGFSLTNPG